MFKIENADGTSANGKAIFANIHAIEQDWVGAVPNDPDQTPYSGTPDLGDGNNKLMTAVIDPNGNLVSPIYMENVEHVFKANSLYHSRYISGRIKTTESQMVVAPRTDNMHMEREGTNSGETAGFATMLWQNPHIHGDSEDYDTDQAYIRQCKPSVLAYAKHNYTNAFDFAKSDRYNIMTFKPQESGESEYINVGVAMVVKVTPDLANVPFKVAIKGSKDAIMTEGTTQSNTVLENGGVAGALDSYNDNIALYHSGDYTLQNDPNVTYLGNNMYFIQAEANRDLPTYNHSQNAWRKMYMAPTPLLWLDTTDSFYPEGVTVTSACKLQYLDWVVAFDH